MAFYIEIEKIHEDDEKACYRFTGNGGSYGIFGIDKKSGEFSLLEPLPGDDEQNVYKRASIKILREWKNGNLPEVTEWAS